MQTTKIFLMAALALMTVACSNDDSDIQTPAEQPAKAEGIPFTATISMGESASTRALAENGSGGLTATWATGEKVALIYTVGSTPTKTDAEVTKQADGTATISATLTSGATNGSDVTIIYPATAADGTTGNVKSYLLTSQKGLLTGTNSIAEKFDVRKGTGKLSISDAGATVNNGTPGTTVALTNQFAIFKFTVNKEVKSLTVAYDEKKFVITPTSATNVLYAALPAVDGQVVCFSAQGSDNNVYGSYKDNVTFTAGKYYQSTLTLGEPNIDLSAITKHATIPNGFTMSGTLSANVKVSIVGSATVTLDGVTINGVNDNNYRWAGITCAGVATIILKDGTTNTVKGFQEEYPGIYVPQGTNITIKGTGSLTASSNGYGAGIGGGYQIPCGTINIKDGVINATGSATCAGIGGGYSANCGSITISGGTINATGGANAAGIGSGYSSLCSHITISGGTINATGGVNAAGIGSGASGRCYNITITTDVTKVTATKGSGSPNSIGTGNGGTCENPVTIGGTDYWRYSAYQNGGDVYLTQSQFIYPSVLLSAVNNSSYIGWILASDGIVYKSQSFVPVDKSPVAMIAYVGNDAETNTTYNHGLALALTDASTSAAWCSQNSGTCLGNFDYDAALGDMAGIANTDALVASGSHTHEAASAARNFKYDSTVSAGTHPTGTSEWFLPSAGQWDKMITAAGGSYPSNYQNLQNNVGLSVFDYWSSTESDGGCAWCYLFNSMIYACSNPGKKFACCVRACLAF